MTTKKHRNTDEQKTSFGTPTGFNNTYISEKCPTLRYTNSQRVLKGKNSSFIVLKNDQNASRASGAGGRGFTQCSAIDIFTGLDSSNVGEGHTKERDPNFFTDAARVYLTQKGKVDKYFGIDRGSRIEQKEKYKSGIGLKADTANIHGSYNVKIVTGRAKISSGEEKNSGGGDIPTVGTIDLIAGNASRKSKTKSAVNLGTSGGTSVTKTLQGVIKGDNMIKLVNDLLGQIEQLNSEILSNRIAIIELGTSYASHAHVGVCAVGPTFSPPSPMASTAVSTITSAFSKIPNNVNISVNNAIAEMNFLNPNFPNYIKSKFVNTT